MPARNDGLLASIERAFEVWCHLPAEELPDEVRDRLAELGKLRDQANPRTPSRRTAGSGEERKHGCVHSPAGSRPPALAAGHPAEDAEAWARRVPSWDAAPKGAVDAFALAVSRMWKEIAHNDPSPWKQSMAAMAQQWLTYRLS